MRVPCVLVHHPRLRAEVQRRGIAVEVCPLSSQVLMLVDDIRNHPLHVFLAEGGPVVLSPDDPALWGAEAASHDWAMAFLAMDNRTGLGTLKRLAINSIEYSSLGVEDKAGAMVAWAAQWARAIESIVHAGDGATQ